MQKFKVSASALIVANRLANPSLLFVGQRLIIPGTGEVVPTAVPQPAASAVPVTGDTYVVQSGDTLYKIAAKLKVDASALIAANQLTNPNLLYVGQRLIIPGGVPPTAVPTAVLPTATPVPATATSPTAVPTATPSSGSYTARGIHGDSFSVESTSVRINTDVWFNFKVTNTSGDDVYYTALAAHTDVGYSAWSWTNQRLGAGESLSWRDHIKFDKTGTYQLYLGICFAGDTNACKSQPWDRLSPSVTVSVQ
jgi:LysM repeat protein